MQKQEQFSATREEALRRLADFLPRSGAHYARLRSFDLGPKDRGNVSVLSPYLRHRVITEHEVCRRVLEAHSFSSAEKFIQEVCWRTYWKGWLEHHPSVWSEYLSALASWNDSFAKGEHADRLDKAVEGRAGIDAFDAWAQELVSTGYLHNHARMWFASIWIFTLRLPWELGADFFYRHLLDGDPASNTLSWRWVGGLQTRGKTYLARPDNIRTFTKGRFRPGDALARSAPPLAEESRPEQIALREPDSAPQSGSIVMLLIEDDLFPESWPVPTERVAGIVGIATDPSYPGLSQAVRSFKKDTLADALRRAERYFKAPAHLLTTSAEIADFVRSSAPNGAKAIITVEVPIGPSRDTFERLRRELASEKLPFLELRREWDALFWPHATKGFFRLKKQIRPIFEELGFVTARGDTETTEA